MKKFSYSIKILKKKFNRIINSRKALMYLNSNELKECIDSMYFIDIDDWKKCYLFNVISKRPQVKIGKFLKLITGSSVVPINGLSGYCQLGGKINLEFGDCTESFHIYDLNRLYLHDYNH